MKILRVYLYLPPNPGGMEKHIMRLSQEQIKQSHEVTIAFSSGEATSDNDVHIKSCFDLKKVRPQFIRDALFFLGVIKYFWIKKSAYDVVHIHGDWSSFFFGHILKRVCSGKVLVGSVHDSVKRGFFWRIVYRGILKKYSFLYCSGNGDAKYLNTLLAPKVYWRPSGIDELFLEPRIAGNKEIDVINIGTFSHRKNHKLMLTIASLLPNVNFVFVGDGPLLSAMKEFAKFKNLQNVQFLGRLDYETVSSLMQQSKIFLMTSFSEGTPTTFLESMASGNAVISSKSNDFSNVIENEISGYILDGFVAEDYALKINNLLRDPNKLATMSTYNAKYARKYSWSEVAMEISSWMTHETNKSS